MYLKSALSKSMQFKVDPSLGAQQFQFHAHFRSNSKSSSKVGKPKSSGDQMQSRSLAQAPLTWQKSQTSILWMCSEQNVEPLVGGPVEAAPLG
jgi:hypothetical protein